MLEAMGEKPRVAPGMLIGNFNREIFTTKQFVTKVIDITPDLAREFLERAGVVHNHSNARIEQYAATMAGAKWKLTHQGLAFNWNGKLVDGYLRLQAILKSGETEQMQVTFGLDPADYPAIDTGYGRKARHLLHLAGAPKGVTMGAEGGIKLYLRYTAALTGNRLPPASRIAPQAIHAFHEANPDFLRITEEVLGTKQTWKEVMSPGVALCLAYMADKKGHPVDVIKAFLKGIGNFAGQDERHPILVLYKTLHKDKEKGIPRPEESLAKSIRAYNKWVRKGKMNKVHGIGITKADDAEETDGAREEHFPVIIKYLPVHHRNINTVMD